MDYDLLLVKDQIIELNRVLLLQMTEGERVDFLERIFTGYCQQCGKMIYKTCHCQNDE